MPRTFGEQNRIHISQVTALIEHDFDLPSLPEPVLTIKTRKLAKRSLT